MNYNDALNYIGSRLRFGIKPGLDRTRRLLCRLGEPQKKLRFVHVAGTNGKGSTCTYIASALTCAGKKTGLYTSPYICDFRERMQIDGHMIEKERLAEITQRVSQFVEEGDPLTEFELITCIAMVWFAECGCDVVVLEVGLGGRLDSTNVIDAPLCSVITRIDLDHTAVLGDTISAVAGEKAGIITPCAPVVIAPNQPEDALSVICARARECGCEVIRPAADKVIPIAASLDGTSIMYDGLRLDILLLGRHQTDNAITAVEVLRLLGVSDDIIADGIAASRIPARLERVCSDPTVIIDGAHNPNGAGALADAIRSLLPDTPIHAVMGVLRDKDYTEELELLAPLFFRMHTCDGFSDRCLAASQLAALASEYTSASAYPSPEEAFDAALACAMHDGGAVIVCGSLYLAGHLRGYIIERTK